MYLGRIFQWEVVVWQHSTLLRPVQLQLFHSGPTPHLRSSVAERWVIYSGIISFRSDTLGYAFTLAATLSEMLTDVY